MLTASDISPQLDLSKRRSASPNRQQRQRLRYENFKYPFNFTTNSPAELHGAILSAVVRRTAYFDRIVFWSRDEPEDDLITFLRCNAHYARKRPGRRRLFWLIVVVAPNRTALEAIMHERPTCSPPCTQTSKSNPKNLPEPDFSHSPRTPCSSSS